MFGKGGNNDCMCCDGIFSKRHYFLGPKISFGKRLVKDFSVSKK